MLFGEAGRTRAASAIGPSLPRSPRFRKVLNQHNYVAPQCADPAKYDKYKRIKCSYCGLWVKEGRDCKLCDENKEKLQPVEFYMYVPPSCSDPAKTDKKRVKCDSCGCWRLLDGVCQQCSMHNKRMRHCLPDALLEGPDVVPQWNRKECPSCQRFMTGEQCRACLLGSPTKRRQSRGTLTASTSPIPLRLTSNSNHSTMGWNASSSLDASALTAASTTTTSSKDTYNDVALLHRSMRRTLEFTTSSLRSRVSKTDNTHKPHDSGPGLDIRYCGRCGCLKSKLKCPVCHV